MVISPAEPKRTYLDIFVHIRGDFSILSVSVRGYIKTILQKHTSNKPHRGFSTVVRASSSQPGKLVFSCMWRRKSQVLYIMPQDVFSYNRLVALVN
jgi:hypothetical protein